MVHLNKFSCATLKLPSPRTPCHNDDMRMVFCECGYACDKPGDLPVQIFFYNVHKRMVLYECEFACAFSEDISVQKSSYKRHK